MKRSIKTVLLATTLLLAACSDSDNSGNGNTPESAAPTGELRVIHAAADAPAVNVKADNTGIAGLQGLAFASGSQRLVLPAETYQVSVDGITPQGPAEVVARTDIPVSENGITNVIALGRILDGSFGPVVVTANQETVAGGNTRLQVVHASSNAQAAAPLGVSLYLTAPGASLADAAPATTFALGDSLGPLTVPAGDYRIRITPSGSDSVVFDSGSVGLPGGADLLLVAIDNTGAGDAPVRILVSTGNGGDFEIQDAATGAGLRAVHAASGVGGADIFAASAQNQQGMTRIVENLAFGDTASLVVAVGDDYSVRVNASGGDAETAPIAVDDLPLEQGVFYTAVAAGNLPQAGDPQLTLLALADDRRSIATEVRVRAVHAASEAGVVDVFVTPTATLSLADIEAGNATPTLPDFDFGDSSDYLSLPAGGYDVRVRAGNAVAINAENVALSNGDVVTLIARNPDVASGNNTFGLLLLDD